MSSILKNILQVIAAPQAGWDEINISDCRTEDLLTKAFYPLLAVLALSEFMPMIAYDHTITLSRSLVNALIAFLAYFFTNLIVPQVMALAFPDAVKTRAAVSRMSDFVIYTLIVLVLVKIIGNLLPTDFMPILMLGFLYIPWVIYRGMDYLGLKGVQALWATVLATVLVEGLPLLFTRLAASILII